ncbi:hypothetical protein [Pseudarthrobacter cellobiosi]|uniref:hypothetical protein n=1 Tax=Pseudarthrobacter cellobiosi TaxID=2953654 RepID=UPI00208F4826|nr:MULTISPECIES: hypothetical protein [unclassified Pseudarthrobacter]MCO4255493.1 hypothetical protein [Pseudarthrobacter sp. HLT1-5]MCO4273691.1 hypothetical protein [Pseudarthrobacter sp. HLT3-5]
MSTQDGSTPNEADGVPLSVRAQLLATEHWSLLASRSTTQGEVLTRISMFLMFTSASLVSLALVGQATRFSDTFVMLAMIVLATDLLIGLLTQVRVMNVGMEDLMYVLAMNRLRAAYVDLDPGIAKYMLAGRHDDEAGMDQTYYFLGGRSTWSHVAGSSMVFITMANAALTAILLGTFMTLLGWPTAAAVLVGSVCGLAFAGASSFHGNRQYRDVWQRFAPLSPTPPGGD